MRRAFFFVLLFFFYRPSRRRQQQRRTPKFLRRCVRGSSNPAYEPDSLLTLVDRSYVGFVNSLASERVVRGSTAAAAGAAASAAAAVSASATASTTRVRSGTTCDDGPHAAASARAPAAEHSPVQHPIRRTSAAADGMTEGRRRAGGERAESERRAGSGRIGCGQRAAAAGALCCEWLSSPFA